MMKFILDIVSTPAILVALIAILGLVLQKKKLKQQLKQILMLQNSLMEKKFLKRSIFH